MRRAFGDGGATLVLIGDPKQAIYAFRGADVYAYLEAAGRAGTRATLERQLAQRPGADRRLRRAVRAARKLGHEGIVYRTVRAADANRTPRLAGAPVAAPLRVRVVAPRRAVARLHARGLRAATPPRASTSPSDLAADLVALLSSGARSRSARDDGTTAAPRADPPRPRRRARPHPPQRGAHPRRARRGRHPRGHQRRRQRLRHRARARLAAPARGARAPVVARAGALGRADVVPRLDARSGSPRPTRRTGRSSTAACTSWARVLRVRGVASLAETITLAEGLPERGAARRRTASGG